MINFQNVLFMLIITLISTFFHLIEAQSRTWKSPYNKNKTAPARTQYKTLKRVPSVSMHKETKKAPLSVKKQKKVNMENIKENDTDLIAQLTDKEFTMCLDNLGELAIEDCARYMRDERIKKEKEKNKNMFYLFAKKLGWK